MYQKIELIGNLGKDPSMQYTPGGTPVTTFSLATNRRWTDSNGNKQEETVWFTVETWNGLAENCNKYLNKGSRVFVAGRMKSPRVWTGDDGVARCNLEVTAKNVIFLSTERTEEVAF
jgi:single-strand DNA-binding protein